MKRFFPSSIMLTPFVVKHYDESESVDLEETNVNDKTPAEEENEIETS